MSCLGRTCTVVGEIARSLLAVALDIGMKTAVGLWLLLLPLLLLDLVLVLLLLDLGLKLLTLLSVSLIQGLYPFGSKSRSRTLLRKREQNLWLAAESTAQEPAFQTGVGSEPVIRNLGGESFQRGP